MERMPMGGATAFRFTQSEVYKMEKVLEASRGSTPPRAVLVSLAKTFNNSGERPGQKPIQWTQISNWFHNRRRSRGGKVKNDRNAGKAKAVATPPISQPAEMPDASRGVLLEARIKKDSEEIKYEAKSTRDEAWYDVSTILSQRVTASGAREARVRFSGFGSEEDEWVNCSSAIRLRSIPCVDSECVAVLQGDLILCFQEGSGQALYFDANVLDVHRRRHDIRGCRCRFKVQYKHDQSTEVVPLRKVCRRSQSDFRLRDSRPQSDGINSAMVNEVQQQPTTSNPNLPHSAAVDGFASPVMSYTVHVDSEMVLPTSSTPATVPSTMLPTLLPSNSSSMVCP